MARIETREERCKGCGLCIAVCPKKIIAFADHFNQSGFHPVFCVKQEDCTGCAICGRACPDMVIEVYK